MINKEKELELKRTTICNNCNNTTNLPKNKSLQTQALLENLRSELAEENRKLDSKKNEHDLLKSLIDTMEGYPESVKFLTQQQRMESYCANSFRYYLCKRRISCGG